MYPDCSVIRTLVKGRGQLAQLSSCLAPFFWLSTWAFSLGMAATYVVLGRPRMAFRCLRRAAK